MSRLAHRKRDEQGAAALEFALILPILILIVLGIVEFGFAFNTQIALTQAAREGVRVEALETGDGETVALNAFIATNVGGSTPTVDVQECDGAGENARLTMTLPYEPIVLPLSPFTLNAEAVMRCGG